MYFVKKFKDNTLQTSLDESAHRPFTKALL